MVFLQVELGRKQEVVVYDQSSKEAGHLAKDGFVHILLGKLEGTFHRVSLLTGRHLVCVYVCTVKTMQTSILGLERVVWVCCSSLL